jgi:hypothetical protein
MYLRFSFEGDLHRTLEFIPLTVRRKLDLAGLKPSLAAWTALTRAEKLAVCHLPVDGPEDVEVYREAVQGFAHRAGKVIEPLEGGPVDPAAWGPSQFPASLAARLPETGARLSPQQWSGLSEEARYALVRLAEPRRNPEKLIAALRELGLA